jgi:hypothetical protein
VGNPVKGANAMSNPPRASFARAVSFAILVSLGSAAMVCAAEESPRSASAASNLPILLDTIRANRKAMVAINLGLSPDEATKFWPVYDRYQKEISATGDRLSTIIEEYTASFATLSNERALQLVDAYLAAEAERVKIRQRYVAEFAKVLPGRTVARFFQIENKMDAVVRYDLAAAIPVIDEQGSKPAK